MNNSKSLLVEFLEKGARDNSRGYLAELLEKYDEEQPERIYRLLDDVKSLIRELLTHKDDDTYCKRFSDEFEQKCQWAKSFIRKEISEVPDIPAQDILNDMIAYIDRMIVWKGQAVKSGKLDFEEYERLKNLWDGLFERLTYLHRQGRHIEERRIEQNNQKLLTLKADLASLKLEETKQDTTSSKGGWIGNFFWKFYEKTLKVIIDAVLEKWWPK
jgi:hypothetical protein